MISGPQRGWPSDEYRRVCLWGCAVWSQTSDGLQIALGLRQFGSCHSRGRYSCAIMMWFVSRVCPYRHLATPVAGGVERISRGLSLGFGPISLWPSRGRWGWGEYRWVCLLGLALSVSGHRRGRWGGANIDGFVSWVWPYRSLAIGGAGGDGANIDGFVSWFAPNGLCHSRAGGWRGEYRVICLLVLPSLNSDRGPDLVRRRITRCLSLGFTRFGLWPGPVPEGRRRITRCLSLGFARFGLWPEP